MGITLRHRPGARSCATVLACLTVALGAALPVGTATAGSPSVRYVGDAAASGPGVPAARTSPKPSTGQAAKPARRADRVRASDFASVARATLTPGVMAYTDGAQCTTNFVFSDSQGGVYLGYAAHCAGKGEATDTNGCQVGSLPLGTKVDFVVGGNPLTNGTIIGSGTLAYSSWLAMDEAKTTDPQTCAFNDFALVKVAAKDVKRLNPTVPFFGGPTGIDTDGTSAGERVYSYGNSSLRAGISVLSPKYGVALGDAAADQGWNHSLYTLTPGIPGDSGSGFMTRGGKAVGTLSTVAVAPLPLSNGTGDLLRELKFARANSDILGLQLTKGTRGFSSVL